MHIPNYLLMQFSLPNKEYNLYIQILYIRTYRETVIHIQ